MLKKIMYLMLILTLTRYVQGQNFPARATATVNDQLKTVYNPSLLGFSKSSGYMMILNHGFDEDSYRESGNENFSLVTNFDGLGFAYSHSNLRGRSLDHYKLAVGFGLVEGVYGGYGIRWSGDKGTEGEWDLSLTYRPFNNFSVALQERNLFEENNGKVITSLGLGYRPFSDKITLSSDIMVNGDEFETMGYNVGLEAEVVEGVQLSLNYGDKNIDEGDSYLGAGASFSFGIGESGAYSESGDEFSSGDLYYYIAGSTTKGHNLTARDNKKIVKLPLGGYYREEHDPKTILSYFDSSKKNTVAELIQKIKRLKNDKEVGGIIVENKDCSMSFAAREEVREALQEFKDSGKKIITYFISSSQNNYFLTSLSDKIYMYPQGNLSLEGLGLEMTFFKKTLDKLGVEMQAIRHGKYKSAVESFTRTNASAENKEQLEAMLTTLDDLFKEKICEGRNFSREELETLINTIPSHTAKSALEHKLVDGLIYQDELDSVALALFDGPSTSVKWHQKSQIISADSYFSFNDKKYVWDAAHQGKIAVVYATGSIVMGESSGPGFIPNPFSSGSTMGSKTTADLIRKARTDDEVKAIVIRIDSGGGSGLASDIILREIRLAQDINKKPVVISMGGYAASGGYYIACFGDRIFADRSTLTGSIGVFGLIPSLDSLYNKIGITTEKIKKAKYAGHGGLFGMHKFTADEESLVQKQVDTFYDSFISLVAEGRKMDKEKVDELAQGRVWSGADALKVGLVDELGGLDQAIAYAKDKAGLADLKVDELKLKVFSKGQIFELDKIYASIFYSILPAELQSKLSEAGTMMNYSFGEEKNILMMPYKIEVK